MSEAIEREGEAPVQDADVGRVRRAFAVVLSLATPGAGHFLLGRFRRGAAWSLGITILGLTVLSTMPVSLWTFVGALVTAFVGRVAAAIDTSRLTPIRSSWKTVLLGLTAFFVVSAIYTALVEDPLREYYKTHYVRAFTIPSGGMEPTLLVGDYILTDNSLYRDRAPQRGDIVVFKYPRDENREFIKRIVALPGEQIQIRGRHVYVNGNPLAEPYVKGDSMVRAEGAHCGHVYGCEPIVVPPDSYFVLGDNRENSQDSRYWGFVKREKVAGRVFAIYWSWDRPHARPRLDRVARSL